MLIYYYCCCNIVSVEEIPEDNDVNKKVKKGNENLINGWISVNKGIESDFYKTATTLIKPSGSHYLKEITQLQKGMLIYSIIYICKCH